MTDADRKKAQAERQRRAALRSSVIQELRQQYSDVPEEIREKRDFQTERDSREELHRYFFTRTLEGWFLKNIKTGLNSCRCHLAGKIMRSPWWFVSACPNVRRMPGKEQWCPCLANWAASHTSVTSRRWREGRGQRWASGDVTKRGLPARFQTGWSGPLRVQRVVFIVAGWNFTTQEKEESHEEEYQKER